MSFSTVEKPYEFVYTAQSGATFEAEIQATSASAAKLKAALAMGCPLRRIRIKLH